MKAPFDLEEPRFTQAEVLRMLPLLKAKTLQNWVSRGIIEMDDRKKGKGTRLLYTPLGVVGLDFMSRVTLYGVPPKEASDMAEYIMNRAVERFEREPFDILEDAESRFIPVTPETIGNFRRAQIFTDDGSEYHLGYWNDVNDFSERIRSDVVISVEIDFCIAQVINRIFLLEAGKI
ncbi:hypothetical protein ACFOM8_10460 [Paracoccus angustae]|uniref:HTH merR-type domain-containing protein n=2 Tax=Paracoccus angustae TaxID=1671480 RepID=A0ABV7U489_9RHOB